MLLLLLFFHYCWAQHSDHLRCAGPIFQRLHPPRGTHGNLSLSLDTLRLVDEKKTYYSQVGQDKLVDDLLRGKKNGFFIEAGGADGEYLSNTLFFEVSREWTGLLVEANPFTFTQLLSKGRNVYAFEGALSTSMQITTEHFLVAGELGALTNEISQSRQSRIDNEIPVWKNLKSWQGAGRVVSVLSVPLPLILRLINHRHVDFFSLDVEGAELPILETVFASADITIDVITVETNGEADRIGKLLTHNNFVKISSIGGQDEIWRNKKFI